MKHLRKNVLASAVGYVLPLVAALVSIPLLLRYLGTDGYGVYAVCLSLLGFMALVDFGMGQAVVRYVADYEAAGERGRVQAFLQVVHTLYWVVASLGGLALWAAAPWFAGRLYEADWAGQLLAQQALQVAALPLALGYVNQFFFAVCKAYHRFDLPALIHNGMHLLAIALAVGLVIAGYGLAAVMWGYALVYAGALVAGYAAACAVLPASIALRPRWGLTLPAGVWGFSGYTFVGNLVGVLTSRADKVAVGLLLGAEAVSYYQIPYTMAQMANGVMHALTQITLPRFAELARTGKRAEAGVLYRQTLDAGLLLSMGIAVLLVATGEVFLAWWLSPDVAAQVYPLLVVMAGYFFLQTNTLASYWVLQGEGMARLTAWVAVADATVYAMALYILASLYGVKGAAFALFFLLFGTLWQYRWVVRLVDCSYAAHWLRLFGFAAGVGALAWGLLALQHWLALPVLAYIGLSLLVVTSVGFGIGWLGWRWHYRGLQQAGQG